MKKHHLDSTNSKAFKKDLKDCGPDTCSSSEDEDVGEQVQIIKKDFKKQRNSVSAEAYGIFNKRENFKPKNIPKSDETKKKIFKRISEAFMFNCLDQKELEIIVNAMEETSFKPGDCVIQQGEDGNYLYVIEEGELDCFKKYQSQVDKTFLKTYKPGESFGELALLYNAPRAATIISKTNSLLWALDRETFNHIVKDAAMKKREIYEAFLMKLPLLSHINDPYEKTKIADCIEKKVCDINQTIIQAGVKQGNIYFVESGEVTAVKNGEPVFKYKIGDYFGEISLLTNKNQPFQFVSTAQHTTLLIVGEGNYKTTLQIVSDKLINNLSKYKEYI